MTVDCVAMASLMLERSVTVGSSLGPVPWTHAVWPKPANCRLELHAGEPSSMKTPTACSCLLVAGVVEFSSWS